jgi:hypothetical protein
MGKTKTTTKKLTKAHAMRAAASYFASGLGTAAEVRGVAMAGYHVGLTCSELGSGILEEAEKQALTATRVFVDSGAFAEVKFNKKTFTFDTVKPLTDADWAKRMAVYKRLAKSIGCDLFVVAPDKVGDQLVTLERLKKYAPDMREIRAMHGFPESAAKVIVPVQGGAMDAATFAQAALEALGMTEDEIVWGIPSKKGATTTEQLGAFAATCQPDARFHLLGMGPQSKRYPEAVEAILEHCPDAAITCDSVRVTALVGRDGKDAPRALTAEQDAYRAQHPGAPSSEVKYHSTKAVLGRESVSLMLDNGYEDTMDDSDAYMNEVLRVA